MSTTYTLRIKTGEKKYAGTDANVFAILYGEYDDTGKSFQGSWLKIHKGDSKQIKLLLKFCNQAYSHPTDAPQYYKLVNEEATLSVLLQ